MFGATEQVSHALQTKNTMVQEAFSSAKMAEAFVQRQTSNDAFDRFCDYTVTEAQNYSIVLVLPRYRCLPRHLDDGADQTIIIADSTLRFLVKEELSRRFDQESLALPKVGEQLLLDALQDSDEVAISIPDVIVNACSGDIDVAKLKDSCLHCLI